ncbi:g7519 [Coccomyxa viridis]|uniref:Aminomethyltransferase n=1 Tax=Coccomyxa viridis TaxID=1274662 RepID=A0ABP1G4P2_9CHLO
MTRQVLRLLAPVRAGLRSRKVAGQPAAWCAPTSRGFASDADLKKTPLYDFHVEHGGKMVPFAGWSMPIQYKDSIMDATMHCRENGSLFDVSHMCGLTLKGKDTIPFLEKLVVGDIQSVQNGSGTLSVFTNENGGIIDDTVITKVADDEIYLVVNAGCREKDLAHINKHLEKFKSDGGKVDITVHDDRSLLALQGPAAVETLQPLVDLDLSKVFFSNFHRLDIAGIPCYLTRTGYTGEDGFEISVPDDKAVELAKKFLENPRNRLCGLGARDSLRLEAGLCLYGNDLNEERSPVEAGLTWTIGKRRREACDFIGGEVIKKQLAEGVTQRRVGLVSTGAPPRAHSPILNAEGKEIGEITSGAFSPCLKKNVAMGYVEKKYGKAGTQLKVSVRGKESPAEVSKMPFVPNTYFKEPTAAS